LRCLLIAFVPYLSYCVNLHRGLINTFWSKHLSVFCSRTSVSCQPLVVILVPTRAYGNGPARYLERSCKHSDIKKGSGNNKHLSQHWSQYSI
ncbi:unnamed protein product, partial [Hymenolepis diminuta]